MLVTPSTLSFFQDRIEGSHSGYWSALLAFCASWATKANSDFFGKPAEYNAALAFAYLLDPEGNLAYGQKARDVALAMANEPMPSGDYSRRQYLGQMAYALDWAWDVMTDIERGTLRARIADYVDAMRSPSASEFFWGISSGHVFFAAGALCSILEDGDTSDNTTWQGWMDGLLDALDNGTNEECYFPIYRHFGAGEGGTYEGSGPESLVNSREQFGLHCLPVLDTAIKTNLSAETWWNLLGHWLLWHWRGDRTFHRQGENRTWAPYHPHTQAHALWIASQSDSDYTQACQWLGAQEIPDHGIEDIWGPYHIWTILFHETNRSVQKPTITNQGGDELRLFGGPGKACFRSGWETTDVSCLLSAPKKFTGGHTQRDAGALWIARSKPLVISHGFYNASEHETYKISSDKTKTGHRHTYCGRILAHSGISIFDSDEPAENVTKSFQRYLTTASRFGRWSSSAYGRSNDPRYIYCPDFSDPDELTSENYHIRAPDGFVGVITEHFGKGHPVHFHFERDQADYDPGGLAKSEINPLSTYLTFSQPTWIALRLRRTGWPDMSWHKLLMWDLYGKPDEGEEGRAGVLTHGQKTIDGLRRDWHYYSCEQGQVIDLITDLEALQGQWVEWFIEICLDWKEDGVGYTKIWRNGALVKDFTGANCYNDATGPYPKFGIYLPSLALGTRDEYIPDPFYDGFELDLYLHAPRIGLKSTFDDDKDDFLDGWTEGAVPKSNDGGQLWPKNATETKYQPDDLADLLATPEWQKDTVRHSELGGPGTKHAYLVSDLTGWYYASKVTKVRRHVLWVKKGQIPGWDDPVILVFDDLDTHVDSTAGKLTQRLFWQTQVQPTGTADAWQIDRAPDRCFVRVLTPTVEWNQVQYFKDLDGYEYLDSQWYDGLDGDDVTYPADYDDSKEGVWRIEINPATANGTQKILTVFFPCSGTKSAPPSISLIDDGTWIGATIGGVDCKMRVGDTHEALVGDSPDTTPPAAPTNLVGTPLNQAAKLDWDDNTEPDLSHYEVWEQHEL